MSNEKIIHTHEAYEDGGEHQHTSMASHRRGLDSSASRLVGLTEGMRIRHIQGILQSIRRERTLAHEAGEDVDVYPDITHDVWLDTISRENVVYDASKPREMNSPEPTRIDPSS